jgi:4-hydroxy-2-oxoheptanedioate aldolase
MLTTLGALDSGAHGVLVPLLYTQSDAARLVSSAKFPPQGTRGFGSPFPMEKFHPSLTTQDYLLQANQSLTTIVQIETKEALANVDAIAATEGIDVLLIGPFDLGNNIGHPILDGQMHTELTKAIDVIQKAATRAGKSTGIYCTSGEQSKHFADKGFNMISVAADMIALPAYLTETLKKAKGEIGEAQKMTGPYGR